MSHSSTKAQLIDINSHLKLSEGLILKNRVVVPPMASQTATRDGCVTSKTVGHYQRLADSHASLIMVEYTYVHVSGKSEEFQLGIDHDDKIVGLKILSIAINDLGCKSAIQLTHACGKSKSEYTGGKLLSPSGVAVPTRDGSLEIPEIATHEDIVAIKDSFVTGALRAKKSGFDLIELHCAHGYGINQWLSPLTNKRSDLSEVIFMAAHASIDLDCFWK